MRKAALFAALLTALAVGCHRTEKHELTAPSAEKLAKKAPSTSPSTIPAAMDPLVIAGAKLIFT